MDKNNKPTDLLVISSYPRQGSTHGAGTVGIASYCKNTLKAMQKAAKNKEKPLAILVLGEKLKNSLDGYIENGIKVKRVWQKNSMFSFFRLLREVLKTPRQTKIIIEFELSMFGGYFNLVWFVLFLGMLKFFKRNVSVVIHQVIDDINSMAPYINLRPKSIKTRFINIIIRKFYRLLGVWVHKIIVFENVLKNRLAKFINPDKITIIPHGIEKYGSKISRVKARQKLGLKNEFVVLYFGFMAWYKGADWIVDEFSKMSKSNKYKLILAGGSNPNHSKKTYYTDYVANIKKQAMNSKNIVYTGFVLEKEIPLYFQACNLVVLPYRALMSASGPMAITSSFNKPFIISNKLKGILKTSDLKKTINKYKIEEEICFSLNNSFYSKLRCLAKNKQALDKLTSFSKNLRKIRSFDKIGELYLKEVL